MARQQIRCTAGKVGHIGFGSVAQRKQGLPHHFLEQVLLAVEIQIDGALADAGALGDVIELGGSEALLHERIKRSINDGDAAGFLLQFAFPCPWQFERCTHGLEPDGDMPAS